MPGDDRLTPLIRAAVLDAASEAVLRDRAATHGAVEDSFARIAAYWSIHLGVPVTAWNVARMLGLMKAARCDMNPGHADNYVDDAGYAACAAELAGARP